MMVFIKNHVYIIYSKAVPANVVDLKGGSPDNNIPCQGYPDPGNSIYTFSSQWLIKEVPGKTGVYTLRNLHGGTYLNLYGGSGADGALIQGFAKATAGYEANQEWKISPASAGYYRIQSVAGGTYMDLDGGNAAPQTRIWGYRKAETPNQEWRLRCISRSAAEIATIVDDNNYVNKQTFKSYLSDAVYITLPSTVRQIIYDSTVLSKTKFRPQIFDCDDFAFVLKAAVAKWGNNNLRCDGFAILFGIMIGKHPDPTKPGHSYNWYLDQTLSNIIFCEPQDGTENSRSLYQGYVGVY